MSKSYIHAIAFNADSQIKQEITISVESAYKVNFQKALKLAQIRLVFVVRKDNDQRQLRTILSESTRLNDGTILTAGKAVSFFPLIGILPNSKRREIEYDFDYTAARFCTKRHTPAISVQEWWDWVKSGLPYDTWLANRALLPVTIESSEDNSPLILTASAVRDLAYEPTTLEQLVEAGLTRTEAIEVITNKVYENK